MGERAAAAPPSSGASVCFALTDVVGSTRLWELDPLAMDAAVARHDELVRNVIEGAGGRLVKHRGEGDSTFSTFTDPVAALQAAADVVRALSAQTWPGDLVIRIRTGVHIGAAIERDGDWYGPTVNRTARLRGLAEPDQILVSTAVSDLVGGRLPSGLALVDRGGAALRGIDRPEWVRQLVDERADAPQAEHPSAPARIPLPATLAPGGHELPLLGRGSIVDVLRSRWTEVEAGRQRAVLLSGEAGIGKSRLTRELASHAHARGGAVLHTRCDAPGGDTIRPLAATVANLLGALTPSDARRLVGEGAEALARLDGLIAERLNVRSAGATVDLGSVLDAVVDLVAALAAEVPVLAIVDDLHLAGDPLTDLISRLVGDERRPPLLLVATVRPTDVAQGSPVEHLLAELDRDDAIERVRLTGIDAEATRDLVALAVGGMARAEGTARVLHGATLGNPLFLTEILHDLDTDGALLTVEDPEDLVLPESVHEIATDRMARLPAESARALRVAAVLGREIDRGLLASVSGVPRRDLLDAEEAWEQLGLVVPGVGGRPAFAHDLLLQAIRAEVPADRQRSLHRRAARAVDAAAEPAVSARHWQAAAEPGDGMTLAVAAALAGGAAVDHAAVEEAMHWADVGLRALADDDVDAPELRGPLLLIRAEAALHSSVDAALEAADAAATDARSAGDARVLARAALVRCNGYTVVLSGEDPAGMSLHEEALTALGTTAPELRSRLLANLANHRARRDGIGVAATPIADEAVELARASDDPAVLANALRIWVQVRQGAPDAVARLARADEMVAAAARTGDRWELVLALQRRAGTRLELGDRSGYETDVADAERRAARLDTATARYETRFRRVLRALLDGRFDDARRHLSHLADLAVVLPTAMDAWATQTLLLEREVGTLADMVPLIEDAVARNPSLVGYQAGLAMALVDADRAEDARTILDRLRAEDWAAAPRDSSWPSVLALLAEVAVRTGHRDATAGLRAELAPYSGLLLLGYESICLGAADRYLAMLDASDGRSAEALFNSAAALEQRVDAPALLARTRLWHGIARLEAGDPDGAAVLLQAASESAGDLGMTGVGAQADELLQRAASRAR